MSKNIFYLILFLFIFSSCTSKNEEQKELTISTNSWIGYTPLFYAKEKGYLDQLNIKLITNISLLEATDEYLVNNADMVTTTQHELHEIQKNSKDTVAIILLDRSDGGDMILSNKSIKEIKQATTIYAYLEIASINTNLLRDFIRSYKLDENKFHFINKEQIEMEDIKQSKQNTIIIVTYSPYDVQIKKNGFQEIASTRTMKELLVIDSLSTHKTILKAEYSRIKKLKQVIDKSIQEIQKNKRDSYKLVKPYLENLSYKAYLDALQDIKWINHPSKELLRQIEPLGYKREYLLP